MSYIDGVVCAVPTENKQAYIEHARQAAELFQRHGALGLHECWGDDVPEGKVNSMHTAVMRKPDETVVMSFITWPSKEVRDAAWQKLSSDEQMRDMTMPFDGSRMIHGGFEVVLET